MGWRLDGLCARNDRTKGYRGSGGLRQPWRLNQLYERVKADAGRIDVLCVNAGGGTMLPLGSITEEQYDDTFGRNVKGILPYNLPLDKGRCEQDPARLQFQQEAGPRLSVGRTEDHPRRSK
jgi:NAD(P)-dependent dehydrogenase (short-subunit alcohol dehydrogenase family)